MGLSSCSQVERGLPSAQVAQFITINDIKTMQVPGQYHLEGTANLPDKTLIAVSAIRPLMISIEPNGPGHNAQSHQRYSILDRQLVEVVAGDWQAELSLTGAQTGFETWQAMTTQFNGAVNPQSEVEFIATLDPGLQSFKLTQQLSKNDGGFENGTIRLNDDGELFAIANKTLEISPPALEQSPNPSAEQAQAPALEYAQPASDSDALELKRNTSDTIPLAPDAYLR